jgi:hypothetical protein
MSRLSITDLVFLEWPACEPGPCTVVSPATGSPNPSAIIGGRRLTPSVSTAVATGVATRTTTFVGVGGNAANGFAINTRVRGSAAAAQASAVSIGGVALAGVFVSAG